ncbi:MAG TPA: EAL domain-containing protein [Candidatus Polarisedimenticolaceae bacterium]|nr:EAL domain-containing protein [Candidatus Polarisedimenticolaceae bacterium]
MLKRHVAKVLPYVAIFAISGVVYLVGALEPLDRALIDAKFRIAARQVEPEVVIVAVDPPSLLESRVWPWSATDHATTAGNLLRAGARRIAFNVDVKDDTAAGETSAAGRLLQAMGARLVVPVSAQRMRGRFADDGSRPIPIAQPAWAAEAEPALHARLADSDGVVRRYAMRGTFLGRQLPSVAHALSGRGVPADDFYIDYGIEIDSIPVLSYAEVRRNEFDPAVVRGRSVVISPTAVELDRPLAVPRYDQLAPGLVDALAVQSLASGRALERISPVLSINLTLALCLMLAAVEFRFSWLRGLVWAVTVVAAIVVVSVGLQLFTPLLIDVSPMILVVAGAYGYRLARGYEFERLRPVVRDKQSRETETLMRHVVSHSFDAIVTLRDDGTTMTFNRVAQKMFGYDEDEAIGRNISDFIRLPHAEDRMARQSEIRGTRRALYETEGFSKDGRRFPVELAVTWIAAEGIRRRVMFMRDITERKAQQEALRYQATHDALTDLPNRSLLTERLEHAVVLARQHAWPVAFLLLDLDRFKEINDTLGHHVGDELLRKIARRLESLVRESDTIARLGGDEFAVLMPATGLDNAQQMARGLALALEEPFQVEGLALQVESSVGITLYPEHGNTPSALIRRADVAMYAAKKERQGVVVYDPEQDFTSIRLLALTGDLRRAIHDSELNMHFQPKVSARTGRPLGVEALARWRHPTHGDIPPDEFVGLAEHSGLIQPLTQWVLETALGQCARWERKGISLSMSVNLSARNLLDESLPDWLKALLESTRLPVRRLTLEITESVIMEDPKRAMDVLTELHKLGVRISIDDFGTGYSSLGYLKKLPATEIKIDKSFVMEMDRNPDDRTIVHSTIELAHNLGLSVVAEGVSSRQTWEELKRLGCDTGQGYYFSRPLPADRLVRWYREALEGIEAPAAAGDSG